VAVLATSRQALDVAAERVWQLFAAPAGASPSHTDSNKRAESSGAPGVQHQADQHGRRRAPLIVISRAPTATDSGPNSRTDIGSPPLIGPPTPRQALASPISRSIADSVTRTPQPRAE